MVRFVLYVSIIEYGWGVWGVHMRVSDCVYDYEVCWVVDWVLLIL